MESCQGESLFAGFALKALLSALVTLAEKRSARDDQFPRSGRGVLRMTMRAGYRHLGREKSKFPAKDLSEQLKGPV